ncbi:hypothetical protein [Streptomyces natalensis]|nr:hypothetical protein [Streptomyces natalensis]
MPMPIHFGQVNAAHYAPGGPTYVFCPAIEAGQATSWGIAMFNRHVLSVALVVSGALALTACGPDDGDMATPGSSASPSQSATAKPAGDDKGKDGCPTLAKGHKLIWVHNVEGAMANIIARDAKMLCNTKMDEGAFYHPEGPLKTYSFDMNSKVTVVGKDGPEVRPATNTGKTLSGIGHVKECADPNHKQYDSGQSKDKIDEYCMGQNYYDVVVGPDNKITEMTERYGS